MLLGGIIINTLVSVIVPVYKVERYIYQCVNSILHQTYRNIEIILVDDGSPDDCGKICDIIGGTDKRIRVIHKENGGLSDARNAGIEVAHGEYITFVDSDDLIESQMIEKLLEVAEKYNADIAECKYTRCSDTGVLERSKVQKKRIKVVRSNTELMRTYLNDTGLSTTAWGKLYKRHLFSKIRYPKGKLHEDVFTTYQLIGLSSIGIVIPYVGYIYRINSEGIMHSSFSNRNLHAIEGKLQQAKYIERKYPILKDLAYKEIIYSCNCCLRKMAIADYYDKKVANKIKKLYLDYGKYYLKSQVSITGKIFCIAAIVNFKLAYRLVKISSGIT